MRTCAENRNPVNVSMEFLIIYRSRANPASMSKTRHHRHMEDFRDLTYLRDDHGLIWLVKGDHHPQQGVRAYPVYWPDECGERVHPHWGRYHKQVSDIDFTALLHQRPELKIDELWPLPLLPRDQIVEAFSPADAVDDFALTEPPGLWLSVYQSLLGIGLSAEDIGILGSQLVGLDKREDGVRTKDVDFCVYGLEQTRLVRERIVRLRQVLGAAPISEAHIAYHARKFGHDFDPEANDFRIGLQRKWCSIQLRPQLLMTLRFVYRDDEIPPEPPASSDSSPVEIEGDVTDDTQTGFIPRRFNVDALDGEFEVLTHYWGLHCCVAAGDHVRIRGDQINDQQILVRSPAHGIKIIDDYAAGNADRYCDR